MHFTNTLVLLGLWGHSVLASPCVPHSSSSTAALSETESSGLPETSSSDTQTFISTTFQEIPTTNEGPVSTPTSIETDSLTQTEPATQAEPSTETESTTVVNTVLPTETDAETSASTPILTETDSSTPTEPVTQTDAPVTTETPTAAPTAIVPSCKGYYLEVTSGSYGVGKQLQNSPTNPQVSMASGEGTAFILNSNGNVYGADSDAVWFRRSTDAIPNLRSSSESATTANDRLLTCYIAGTAELVCASNIAGEKFATCAGSQSIYFATSEWISTAGYCAEATIGAVDACSR